jgi:hypothetical protein
MLFYLSLAENEKVNEMVFLMNELIFNNAQCI